MIFFLHKCASLRSALVRLNRWKKRGVALIPNKFNIAFGLALLNQGGALVHIYTDGSVLVTVGGVEMGQGLFTKCYQVSTAPAADAVTS